VKADFRLGPDNTAAVAELCRRLEGIPLAIVLAAARVRVLTPGEMLERLEQRFELLVAPQRAGEPRHRSLRAALDWSYHLLSAELQRFFIQLSVFRGGWTLEAAEQVCEAGEPRFGREADSGGGRAPGRALEFLEELEQCSLVVTEAVGAETRYRLLETLREYGAEQLAVAERTALAERHLTYCRDRLSYGIDVAGRTLKQRMDEIEREQHNLRAALDWWEQSGAPIDCIVESEEPHRGILPVYFWQVRGSASEGRQRLARILALPGAAIPSLLRAHLLFVESRLARQLRDHADAYALLQESLAIYQGLGHKAQVQRCCFDLALLAREQGDYAGARSYDEQCLAMAREAGDERGIAFALIGMGSSAYLGGDLGATNSLVEEALRIVRQRPGDYNDMEAIANACELRARVAVTRGDYVSAQTDLEESLALFPELGALRRAAAVRHQLGQVALHQGRGGAAAGRFCENLLFWQQDSHYPEIAACLEGLGEVAIALGDAERAARLLGAAAAVRESRNVPIPPIERADVESAVARAQTALGEAAFAAAWAEGQAIPMEQMVAEALQLAPTG
jgi:tetratricopeptide (TPR) repeat protein